MLRNSSPRKYSIKSKTQYDRTKQIAPSQHRTQHKPPSPPQQLDGPEHEAREAVGERWKRERDCPQGVDPEEKLRTCKAEQEVEKEDEIRIIGTNERSNINESPVHNCGMDTTEYPSSFIPFTEAGSTGEWLEGRSKETLALSLTSVRLCRIRHTSHRSLHRPRECQKSSIYCFLLLYTGNWHHRYWII